MPPPPKQHYGLSHCQIDEEVAAERLAEAKAWGHAGAMAELLYQEGSDKEAEALWRSGVDGETVSSSSSTATLYAFYRLALSELSSPSSSVAADGLYILYRVAGLGFELAQFDLVGFCSVCGDVSLISSLSRLF